MKQFKLKLSVIATAILFLGTWTLALGPAQAAVPKLLSYQGVLKDSGGQYLSGSFDMTFRLYTAGSGGTALWSETQSGVSVASGQFSVELGSVTTLNLDFDMQYWMSIEIASDGEMSPRIKLTSVGYAYNSEDAETAFTQSDHDQLSHMNVEGVKSNTTNLAKTNFKLDAYSQASANSMGDMVIDTFSDASGIDAGLSSDYQWNDGPDYDVTVAMTQGSVAQENTNENDSGEFLSSLPYTQKGVGQRFQHTEAIDIDKVAFKWRRYGSPTGNVRFRIYTSNGGNPGTMLGETANIDVATQPTTYTEVTYDLTSNASIQANTEYIAVMESVDGSGDGGNYLRFKTSNSNPYSNGDTVAKNSSGNWSTWSTSHDLFFRVYDAGELASSATVISVKFIEPVVQDEAILIADENLNTGTITYYISRDDGLNWTQATNETITDISSQPSDVDMRWKAVITGDAELEAVALAL